MNKPIIHISFSGGRTSAYMTQWYLSNFSDMFSFIVTFANTGLEKEETLQFVKDCDDLLGFNTVWLEAVVHPEHRRGTTHKVVSFETATRDGSIFEAMIAKYGIPNKVYKHCTRELKVRPMNSYLRSLGLKPKQLPSAIGIRSDEERRASRKAAKEDNLIYPLVDSHPVTKEIVLDYWLNMPFDLQLEEHNGNCVMCFEKSNKKLCLQYAEDPSSLEFHIRMEKMYGHINNQEDKPPRVFFRGNNSANQIKEMALAYKEKTP